MISFFHSFYESLYLLLCPLKQSFMKLMIFRVLSESFRSLRKVKFSVPPYFLPQSFPLSVGWSLITTYSLLNFRRKEHRQMWMFLLLPYNPGYKDPVYHHSPTLTTLPTYPERNRGTSQSPEWIEDNDLHMLGCHRVRRTLESLWGTDISPLR